MCKLWLGKRTQNETVVLASNCEHARTHALYPNIWYTKEMDGLSLSLLSLSHSYSFTCTAPARSRNKAIFLEHILSKSEKKTTIRMAIASAPFVRPFNSFNNLNDIEHVAWQQHTQQWQSTQILWMLLVLWYARNACTEFRSFVWLKMTTPTTD